MTFNSRAVALLLSVTIALITTAFLSLVESTTPGALAVAATLSFSSSYILINITLEFMIFREVNKVYNMLDQLKKEDLSFIESDKKKSRNPIKRVNQEIFSYARRKEKEITELKKMETFRREFLADVSHELKTPIFAAQGFVHTLLDGAVKDKNVRNKFLKKAAKSLDGLDIMVQNLLAISQMESGEIKMHYERFNIYKLVLDVFEQFEGKAEKKDVNLSFAEGCPTEVMVYADPQRIHQVMNNLISNAIKYSKTETIVVVDFEIQDDEVITYVKDNGLGIPEEDLNRIFERFYRVDKSRSKDKGGTGLGLAIVKHIIDAHGCKISVNSSLSKGSIFRFNLPKFKE